MGRMERVAGAAAVLAAAVCLLAATPAGAQALPDGRVLQPDGTLVGVGNFPTGGALTPDGRFYWTVSSGFARNGVQIVSVAEARVVSTVQLPGASGGIVMDPRRPVAYVSGVADSNSSGATAKVGSTALSSVGTEMRYPAQVSLPLRVNRRQL